LTITATNVSYIKGKECSILATILPNLSKIVHFIDISKHHRHCWTSYESKKESGSIHSWIFPPLLYFIL